MHKKRMNFVDYYDCQNNLLEILYSRVINYLLLFQDENQGEFNSSETDDDIDLPGQSCPFQIKAIHITEIALIQKNKASRTFQVLCLCLN